MGIKIKIFFRWLLYSIMFGIASISGAAMYFFYIYDVDISIIESADQAFPSILLDDEGHEWARFERDKRKPVSLRCIPWHLIHAFVAAEDHQFFEHQGISYRGIVRSLLVNIYHGRRVQGASTITQQLVRLLFFDAQKTFERKLKEQFVALLIEQRYPKERILELYLNTICLGCGIYGVQAASERFWGKQVEDISIAQAAALAGIVKSPQRYCPLLYPLSCQKRKNIVLHSMYKLGYITQEEYTQAVSESIDPVGQQSGTIAPYFRHAIAAHVESVVGKNLYTDGLVIQTTMNRHMQHIAQKAFDEHVAQLTQDLNVPLDGALVSLDVSSGEIKALIGGKDFAHSTFNRALQARRQIGSTIKPLIYGLALEQGMYLTDTILDEPISFEAQGTLWQPNNSTKRFEGQVTLAYALSHSHNIGAIKVLQKIGIPALIKKMELIGIGHAATPYLSMALGCVECSPLEVTGMFTIFAHHGVYNKPHMVRWIKDAFGTKIWKHQQEHIQLIERCVSDQINRVLCAGLERGKHRYGNAWLPVEAIGKTGTTNDSRTCWFVGATPKLATGIYLGRDDNKPLGKNIYGIRASFPIWLKMYQQLDHEQKYFVYDPSLREVSMHSKTGQIVSNEQPHSMKILISRGTKT